MDTSSKTILLVEDEQILAMMEKIWLNKEGFTVIIAGSGENAIDIVKNGSVGIDLILMDIDLGRGLDGTDTAREILKLHDIPLLFLSSHTEPEIVQKTEQITSYGYVVKGSTNTVLLASIKMAFKLHKAHTELSLKEKWLQETEANYHTLADSGQALIWTADVDKRCNYFNKPWLDFTGRSIEQELGFGWAEGVHASDMERCIKIYSEAFDRREKFSMDYRLLRNDGQYRWIHDSGSPRFNTSGEFIGYIGHCFDITERKQIEDALLVSEKKYKNMFDNNPLPMWVYDLETLAFLDVNAAAIAHYGYSFDEFLHMTLKDIRPAEDIEALLNIVGVNEKNYRTPGVWRHRKKNGEIIYVEIASHTIEYGNSQARLALAKDVTQYKKTVEELRRSEEMARLYFNGNSDAMFLMEIEGNDIYRCLAVNSAYLASTGLEASQVIGRRLNEIKNFPDSVINLIKGKYKEAAEAGTMIQYEETVTFNDGPITVKTTLTPIYDKNGRCTHLLGSSRDISEHKRLDDAQKFLEQCGSIVPHMDFFKSLARYLAETLSMDYVCIDRLLDGRKARTVAIYYDGEFEDNVEYTLQDTPCGDVVDQSVCCFPRDVRHLFPNDVILQEMSAESYVGTTLKSTNGRPIGLIAVISRKPLANPDRAESILQLVSLRAAGELERREAEEQSERYAEELKASNATKDKFLSIIAHDLKGPFGGFVALTDDLVLSLDELKKEELTEYAFVMNATAKKMYDLLTNLLEWSRLQTDNVDVRPVKIDLHKEVENIRDLFASLAAGKAIRILNEVPPGIFVRADSKMLSSIIRNLVSNAIKFTQPGGKVAFTARQSGNSVYVSVADTGVGMDAIAREKLFRIDSGYSTKGTNGEEGTGLGLVLCCELVKKNGGEISVKSEPGRGSEFIFSLPAHPGIENSMR